MSFSHFLATMVFNADLANSEDWESESVHMLLEHSYSGKLVDSLLVLPQLGTAWLRLQSHWLLPIDGPAL